MYRFKIWESRWYLYKKQHIWCLTINGQPWREPIPLEYWLMNKKWIKSTADPGSNMYKFWKKMILISFYQKIEFFQKYTKFANFFLVTFQRIFRHELWPSLPACMNIYEMFTFRIVFTFRGSTRFLGNFSYKILVYAKCKCLHFALFTFCGSL
jgi:hypothetical protein